MTKTILVLHYEFLLSYLNKNIGYFVDAGISKGYKVDFVTLESNIESKVNKNNFNLIGIKGSVFESIFLYKYLILNARKYEYVWIYPHYKSFVILLLILRIFNVKIILKTDSMLVFENDKLIKTWYRYLRKKIILLLVFKIIVENNKLLEYFENDNKVFKYSIGLPQKNINLIRELSKSVKQEKTILYLGRVNYAKGLDRLVNAFDELIQVNQIEENGWVLKIIGKVVEENYFNNVINVVNNSSFIKDRVIYENEKYGKEYYLEILKSSLIVLPTRNEGLPNVLADSYFCNRLFLTTTGAKTENIINNKLFYCENTDRSIFLSMKNIINNLNEHYDNFEQIYDGESFLISDVFFQDILDD